MPRIADARTVGQACLALILALVLLLPGSTLATLLSAGLLASGAWWLVSGLEAAGRKGVLLRAIWSLAAALSILVVLGFNALSGLPLILTALGFPVLAVLMRDASGNSGAAALRDQWARNLLYITLFLAIPLAIEIPVATIYGIPDTADEVSEFSTPDVIFVAVVVLIWIAVFHTLFTLYKTTRFAQQVFDSPTDRQDG